MPFTINKLKDFIHLLLTYIENCQALYDKDRNQLEDSLARRSYKLKILAATTMSKWVSSYVACKYIISKQADEPILNCFILNILLTILVMREVVYRE
jgi:hypothetical protein